MKYIKTYEIMENNYNNELNLAYKTSEDILAKKFGLLVHVWGSINHEASINFHIDHSIKKEKLEPIINFFSEFNWKIESINNTSKFKFCVTVPQDYIIKLKNL